MNYKWLDVEEFANRIIPSLQSLADDKKMRLDVDIDSEAGKFEADESKIESVIVNLINNAIKYTPPSGRVSISVRRQDRELVICVSDTGIGIPEQELGKIFDKFYRVYSPDYPSKGTGLGLAIVKEIVTMHNGRIEVESRHGKGSTFTVILPLAADRILQLPQ